MHLKMYVRSKIMGLANCSNQLVGKLQFYIYIYIYIHIFDTHSAGHFLTTMTGSLTVTKFMKFPAM
jgi:hypothetical protein